MALGTIADDNDSLTFPATCIRFGKYQVEPVLDVELSISELRICFRTDGSSTANATFVANPLDFVKTVYNLSRTSTTILFRIREEQFKGIRLEINGFVDETVKVPSPNHWIVIQTGVFNESERLHFEKIASYLLSCDSISSIEIEKMIEKLVDVEQKIKTYKRSTNGGEAAAGKDTYARTKPSPQCIIEYPLNERGAKSVTVESYKCLAVDEYLDDAIIDFYAEYLYREVLTPDQRRRTHIFSVFFHNVLTARSARGKYCTPGLNAAQKRHERVAKWTKDVNIFEKDFLIVPINIRSHWFLAIVCYPALEVPVFMDTNEPVPIKKRRSSSNSKSIKQPCILIFDSLAGEQEKAISTLREYLTCEYEVKMKGQRVFDGTSMPGQKVRSPIQPNLHDCGLFTLQNLEQFFKDPIKSFEFPINGLDDWYDPKIAVRKRKDIAELIQRLMSTHGTGFPIDNLPQIELPD